MRGLLIILFAVVFVNGCAIAVPIEKEASYSSSFLEDAPTILVVDFKDARSNKRDIGGIGLGYFVVDIDIASEINKKISKKLAERKFNIRKTSYDVFDTEKIKDLIKNNQANALLEGDLERFEMPQGVDAALQTTDLESNVTISLFNADGRKIYQNRVMALAKRYFGLGTIGPAQELVKDCMNKIVDNLFEDQEFISALNSLKHNLEPSSKGE